MATTYGVNGITYAATQPTETGANVLDDYEEGSWTATMGGSVTLHALNDLGSYTKVGRVVTCGGQFRVNDSQSGAAATLTIPFTAAAAAGENSGIYTCAMRLYNIDVAADLKWAVGYVDAGTNYIQIVGSRDDAASVTVDAKDDGYFLLGFTFAAAG